MSLKKVEPSSLSLPVHWQGWFEQIHRLFQSTAEAKGALESGEFRLDSDESLVSLNPRAGALHGYLRP